MVAESDSQHKTHSVQQRFKFVFLMFKLIGFPITPKKSSLPQLVWNVIITFCSYTTYIAMFAHISTHTDDLKLTMRTSRIFVPVITSVWMEINYRFRADIMERLFLHTESFTWEDMPTTDNEGKITMAGFMLRIHSFGKMIISAVYIIQFTLSAIRIFAVGELIYPGRYPFNFASSPMYEVVIFTQNLASLRIGIMFLTTPYLYALLVCIACTQLEKLKAALLHLGHSYMTSVNEFEHITHKKYELRKLQNELNAAVRHHQEIIRQSLNDMTELTECVGIYIVLLCVAFAYCTFGSLLAGQYESVKDAAWSSEWIGTSVSYQRCISFMISVSSKGFNLQAGKILPVTYSTLMGGESREKAHGLRGDNIGDSEQKAHMNNLALFNISYVAKCPLLDVMKDSGRNRFLRASVSSHSDKIWCDVSPLPERGHILVPASLTILSALHAPRRNQPGTTFIADMTVPLCWKREFVDIEVRSLSHVQGHKSPSSELCFSADATSRVFLQTESFTWEDMPTVDIEGRTTMAGWMLNIDNFAKSFSLLVSHFTSLYQLYKYLQFVT
ncbi:hypothetical protein ANN_17314 [Periplaneta americana]|uniref:Odorant receptor n=1 Tax=Periplaneta americana TaxID=6978 RepID=A0ABQ8STL7_PERAM|nr:hypothetical protein ANN_17314 [Periplaneta americana]